MNCVLNVPNWFSSPALYYCCRLLVPELVTSFKDVPTCDFNFLLCCYNRIDVVRNIHLPFFISYKITSIILLIKVMSERNSETGGK